MTATYSEHAAVCAKFYELTVDRDVAGEFVFRHSGAKPGEKALFVGGMFHLAEHLSRCGLELTVVDYSDEMVALGQARLPNVRVEPGDLRALQYPACFDVVFVVGRVFTHMISDQDLRAALRSCRSVLRDSGRLFIDNYEDSRIQTTPYFNGTLHVQDQSSEISRASTTTRISDTPRVVLWNASYSGKHEGREFAFRDSIKHRAWARDEIRDLLPSASFEVMDQGDNFDETSFYTLAKAV